MHKFKEVEVIEKSVREMVKPVVDELVKQGEDYLEIENHKPNTMPLSKNKQKENLKELSEFITKLLSGEEERRLIDEGFQTVFEEAKSVYGGLLLLEDLRGAGIKFMELFSHNETVKKTSLKVFETMQEYLEISDQLLEIIYSIGYKLFQNNEIKMALSVFTLLANINNYIFEYWLAIGICHMYEKNYTPALHAFSVASLIDLQQALPHLYSAEIYILCGEEQLASETLKYCLSISTEESQQGCSSMIRSLKNKIKEGG